MIFYLIVVLLFVLRYGLVLLQCAQKLQLIKLDQINRSVDCDASAMLGDNLENIKEDLKTAWTKLADYFKVTLSNFFIF